MPSELTEHLTFRLTPPEFNAIKQMAEDSFVSKSTMLRQLINEKNSNIDKNFNQKMLVEILMILRHQINDKDLNAILTMVDKFKQKQGIE